MLIIQRPTSDMLDISMQITHSFLIIRTNQIHIINSGHFQLRHFRLRSKSIKNKWWCASCVFTGYNLKMENVARKKVAYNIFTNKKQAEKQKNRRANEGIKRP